MWERNPELNQVILTMLLNKIPPDTIPCGEHSTTLMQVLLMLLRDKETLEKAGTSVSYRDFLSFDADDLDEGGDDQQIPEQLRVRLYTLEPQL